MKQNKIKISVVVPLYNGAILIERCLNSVFQQKGNFDLEVIVIDDGSTDSSLEIVKNYPKPIKQFQQENEGAASARNKGIDAATGGYLAFLDADDYWLPDFLSSTLTFLQSHPNVIAVNTAQVHKIPGRNDIVSPKIIDDNIGDKEPFVLDNFYAFWAKHQHVCTGSVLMRTDIVKKTGGQLKALRISQDLEFWSYLATFGKWGFIPKVLFVSDGGRVTKQRGWLKKNMVRWKSTPSIETFTKRTLPNIKEEDRAYYNQVIGWVAYNFTYGHIMAKAYNKAFNSISRYGIYFPQTKGSMLIKFSYCFGYLGFKITMALMRRLQIMRHYIFTLTLD